MPHNAMDSSGEMPRVDKIRECELRRQAHLEEWIKKTGSEEVARHLAHMERQLAGLRKTNAGLRKHVKQRAAHAEDQILRVPYCPHHSVCGNRPAVCLDTFKRVSEAAAKMLEQPLRPQCPHLTVYVEPVFGELRFVVDDGDSSGSRFALVQAAAEHVAEWLRQYEEK